MKRNQMKLTIEIQGAEITAQKDDQMIEIEIIVQKDEQMIETEITAQKEEQMIDIMLRAGGETTAVLVMTDNLENTAKNVADEMIVKNEIEITMITGEKEVTAEIMPQAIQINILQTDTPQTTTLRDTDLQ